MEWRHFASTNYMEKLDDLRHALIDEHYLDFKASNKDLAEMATAIQNLQEEILGKTIIDRQEVPMTRLPAKCFRSLHTHGALHNILRVAYDFMKEQKYASLELSAERHPLYIEMLKKMENVLLEKNLIQRPRIFLSPNITSADARGHLVSLGEKMHAQMVKDVAGATHILVASMREIKEQNDKESLRCLEKFGDRILIHWKYFPSSYDSWQDISETKVSKDMESDAEHQEAWILSQRWLEDSARFNEWMDEQDYEEQYSPNDVQKSDITQSLLEQTSQNMDDLEESKLGPSKRQRVDEVGEADYVKIGKLEATGEEALAARRDLQQAPTGNMMNISRATIEPFQSFTEAGGKSVLLDQSMDVDISTVPVEAENPKSSLLTPQDQESRFYAEAHKYLAEQTKEIIVPSYAAWFSMATIHDIERRSLPEFFNGVNKSKTPTIYKEYRDFMINTYRLNPSDYLTVTACRRNLAGDVCAIMRVHAFLEQWGLLNYQVDPETRPASLGPAFTGHFRLSADTPTGIHPFKPFVPIPTQTTLLTGSSVKESSPKQLDKEHDYLSKTSSSQQSQIRPDMYASGLLPTLEASRKKYTCQTCGVDCTRVRYHCLKESTMNICPLCYVDGRFPANFFSGDFLKMEVDTSAKHTSDTDWNDQEVLLLLEAIEMYAEDWNRIAEHVGTRTREQCILKFLQLPIEDPYMDSRAEPGPLRYDHLPFSQADNPVMSVIAFLAAAVNPGVAAAAAKAAIDEFSKNLQCAETIQAAQETEDVSLSEGENVRDLDKQTVEKATASALGAAAVKAKMLADYEERRIHGAMRSLLEAQLKRLELKARQLEELEAIMMQEKRQIEHHLMQIYSERLTLKRASLNSNAATESFTIQPPLTDTTSDLETKTVPDTSLVPPSRDEAQKNVVIHSLS